MSLSGKKIFYIDECNFIENNTKQTPVSITKSKTLFLTEERIKEKSIQIINSNIQYSDSEISFKLADSIYQVKYLSLEYVIPVDQIRLILDNILIEDIPLIIKSYINNEMDVVSCIMELTN